MKTIFQNYLADKPVRIFTRPDTELPPYNSFSTPSAGKPKIYNSFSHNPAKSARDNSRLFSKGSSHMTCDSTLGILDYKSIND